MKLPRRMQTLNDLSIRKKLVLVIMLVVLSAMSVSSTAFVVNDALTAKRNLVEDLTALGEVVGTMLAKALRAGDHAAIERLLTSLEAYPALRAAVLSDAEGTVLARYSRDGAPVAPAGVGQRSGYRFRKGRLEVVQTIGGDGRRLGTLYLEADLDPLARQMVQYAGIVVVVLIVSCGAGYAVAVKLQKVISGPILDLTRTAQDISHDSNYSLRVPKMGNDELGTLCDEFNRMLGQIEMGKRALERSHEELERRVLDRTRALSRANADLSREVAERIRTEKELEKVHREFVEAARRAGMEEIATGVLHNVGNVLNSVNVSATMIASRLRASKVSQLAPLAALLERHAADLAQFLTQDARGRQVPRFLTLLAEHLENENAELTKEAESLTANVEHIKAVVNTQQSYAGSGDLAEPTDVNALVEDAVRLNWEPFRRYGVRVEREFAELPPLLIDKQRVMQIVINLIKNAQESLAERGEGERVLRLRTRVEDDRLVLEVADTGLGIAAENLTRIFAHGFTTKPTGHGFGLHSCANAATDMDGTLSVASAGHLQGATFTLKLPLRPVPAMA